MPGSGSVPRPSKSLIADVRSCPLHDFTPPSGDRRLVPLPAPAVFCSGRSRRGMSLSEMLRLHPAVPHAAARVFRCNSAHGCRSGPAAIHNGDDSDSERAADLAEDRSTTPKELAITHLKGVKLLYWPCSCNSPPRLRNRGAWSLARVARKAGRDSAEVQHPNAPTGAE